MASKTVIRPINQGRKQERSIAQNWRIELSCIHHINMIKCRENLALNSLLTNPRCVGRVGEINYFKTVRQSFQFMNFSEAMFSENYLTITVIIETIATEQN